MSSAHGSSLLIFFFFISFTLISENKLKIGRSISVPLLRSAVSRTPFQICLRVRQLIILNHKNCYALTRCRQRTQKNYTRTQLAQTGWLMKHFQFFMSVLCKFSQVANISIESGSLVDANHGSDISRNLVEEKRVAYSRQDSILKGLQQV